MENRNRMQRQNIIIMIMNVVIVVLCVLLFLTGIAMVEELKFAFSRGYRLDNIQRNVEQGNYHWLVEQCYVSKEEGMEGGKELEEYMGVGKYFESAFMYKAFETVGDSRRAHREQDKMEKAYEQMGSWNIVKDDIHQKLGLE